MSVKKSVSGAGTPEIPDSNIVRDSTESNITEPPGFQSVAVPLVSSNAIALPITDKPLTGRSAAELVTKLNEQYAVVQQGGKVVILTFERHVLKVGRAEYVRERRGNQLAMFLRYRDAA
ncbi:MAG: hypothetical protein Q7V17_19825 [Afipia sp.]|nr:hypothetical protein [Afipia sp.]